MTHASAGRGGHRVPILAGLALAALVLAIPVPRPPTDPDAGSVTALRGRIVALVEPVPGEGPPVPVAVVELVEGDRAGERLEAPIEGPGGADLASRFRVGDEVVVSVTTAADGAAFAAVADRWRLPAVGWLAALFVVAVLAVGGWRGARALVALGLTATLLLHLLLPLVLAGVEPLPLAVAAATLVTAATILITEGPSRAAFAAIAGTAGALAIAGIVAAVFTRLAAFTYLAGADLAFLATVGGTTLDLQGILLAALILGAVGVLDDVTVTQAVVVEELAERGLAGRALFTSALAIGRSHIGATVNTLFLAYVGAGLPFLAVLLVSGQPLGLVLNGEEVATEVVRTLAGSLGILAAVPLTTAVAVALAARRPDGRPAAGTGPAVAALGVALVLPLLAIPLGSTAAPPAGVASPSPSPPPDAGPLVAERGAAVEVLQQGEGVGTVTVVRWAVPPVVGAASRRVTVVVAYTAALAWSPATVAWLVAGADGAAVPLAATEPLPALLEPGAARTVTLAAETALDLVGGSIGFGLADDGVVAGDLLFVVPLD